jgi:anthranilate phosphoribosyltransferase
VKRQLLGTFSPHWLEPMADTLRALGSERVWLVHGSDGLDEITTTGPTEVVELRDSALRHFTVIPEEVGLRRADPSELKGGDAEHNAKALMAVLQGKPSAYRDIALINAGAALVIADKASNLKEGVALAAQAIDSGAAKATLERLVLASNA